VERPITATLQKNIATIHKNHTQALARFYPDRVFQDFDDRHFVSKESNNAQNRSSVSNRAEEEFLRRA
jgi:hypothetical protein